MNLISSMTHLQSTELHINSDPQNCHIALDTKDLNHIWVDSVIWCVTHPWSQKAISGMSNCQHRGAIASPWIGHAFHCPSYWFQPQDLFGSFNILNTVNISLPLCWFHPQDLFDGFNIFNIVNILLLQIDSSRKICLTLLIFSIQGWIWDQHLRSTRNGAC